MDDIKMFLANNYIWFLVASGVLLISLIGCLIDYNKKKKENENLELTETLSINEPVEQLDINPNQDAQGIIQSVPQPAGENAHQGAVIQGTAVNNQEVVETLNDTSN